MTERSIAHGTFTVERTYPVAPARVFAAWADPAAKAKWFGDPGSDNTPQIADFREGGREYSAGQFGDTTYTMDVGYRDIVPDNRIVYSYDMTLNGQRISVSVATIEFQPKGQGTRMVITEMGAFLDGLDTVEQRRAGTEQIIDQLGVFLEGAK